ncbi:MAG TPA: NACHT domain-containing protein [Nostocaceae cyanobacterium]|nr:NACHT domain-containing protein [Nostocaceae cyanobacterium]
MKPTRKPKGFLANQDGVKKLKAKKREKSYTYKDIQKKANVTIYQVKRLFSPHWGYKIGTEAIELIASVLDLLPEEIVGADIWYSSSGVDDIETSLNDWRDICHSMLDKWKSLTSNRLMKSDTMTFNIDDIDVSLALVQRKQADKRFGDDNPTQSQSYQPAYQEGEELKYQQFLEQVLKSEQNKKIVIIGEAGAGKTTLLQKIAFWILKNNLGLPIWISLGSLPTPTPKFQDYLLNDWLQYAVFSLTQQIKSEFEELIKTGKIWLLLDGVDEMAVNSGSPLTEISNRLTAWSQGLNLILTCRLNVWEANPYSLNNFKAYRTLQFNQDQVEKFIQDGFQKSNPELGVKLLNALNQPGKERIKDLVKNPLRLMMLCSAWEHLKGNLPDTKAELYQHFVDQVYRWKEDEFKIAFDTRKKLDEKLKELALKSLDNQNNRFWLTKEFIEDVFKDSSLFKLAEDINWLNKIGIDEERLNPQELYAFYHPTFQEYFAALAIDDWDSFLPREHIDKPVEDKDNPGQYKCYRIFEPQWKEVILLWLGRKDNNIEAQKNDFINKLISFNDNCGDFYKYRASFLAAAGISEFSSFNSSCADILVSDVIKLAFGYIEYHEFRYLRFLKPITEGAELALQETDKKRAIKELIDFLKLVEEEQPFLIEVARFLLKIDPTNSYAIKALTKILSKGIYGIEAAFLLLESNPDNVDARKFCTKEYELQTKETRKILRDSFESYRQAMKEEPIKNCNDIENLIQQLNKSYKNLDNDGFDADNDYWNFIAAVERLSEIGYANRNVIYVLMNLLIGKEYSLSKDSYELTDIFKTIVNCLQKIINEQTALDIVLNFKSDLHQKNEENSYHVYQYLFQIMWYCAEKLTYTGFYEAWQKPAEIEMSNN